MPAMRNPAEAVTIDPIAAFVVAGLVVAVVVAIVVARALNTGPDDEDRP